MAATSAAVPPAAATTASGGRGASYWALIVMVVAILVLAVGTGTAWWIKNKKTADASPAAGTSDVRQDESPGSAAPASAKPASPARKAAGTGTPSQPAAQKSQAAAAAPAQSSGHTTCEGVGTLYWLQCKTEGPQTFFKCAPDGKHWNHDTPGCDRRKDPSRPNNF
ncbi:MAG: hypothetical protein EPO06_08885 [Burkholderiaceae bacterium]|nr:MAG: hypothetical protein EPO06_08885 [Burkholderiaceae bacterium]